MNLRIIGWEGVHWMHLTQDREQWRFIMNTVTNFRVPYKEEIFLTRRATVCFSRRTLLHGVG
jgi:hypothetical protein